MTEEENSPNVAGDPNGVSDPKSQICRDFLRGECTRLGNNCKYSHDLSGDGEGIKTICRDFLRGECDRGIDCLFQHCGTELSPKTPSSPRFCHNFQNGKCERFHCAYIHGTASDEEYYKETGRLPPGVLLPSEGAQATGICKDFLNGKCNRSKCRFLHQNYAPPGRFYGDGPPPRKRPMPNWDPQYERGVAEQDRERIRGLIHMVQDLEDENVVIRHKLGRTHRILMDSTEDNKVLLEENKRLKILAEAREVAPRAPARLPDHPRPPARLPDHPRPPARLDNLGLDGYLADRPSLFERDEFARLPPRPPMHKPYQPQFLQ